MNVNNLRRKKKEREDRFLLGGRQFFPRRTEKEELLFNSTGTRSGVFAAGQPGTFKEKKIIQIQSVRSGSNQV